MKNLELLKLSFEAVMDASESILSIYNNEIEVEYKDDGSPLTLADKMANDKICKILSSSNYPILSEESNLESYEKRKKWRKYWLIDPIDGTKGFINRSGEFTINIAFLEMNKPIIGVVYIPTSGTLYFGFDNKSYKLVKEDSFDNFPNLIKNIDYYLSNLRPLKVNHVAKTPVKVIGSKNHSNEKTRMIISEIKNYFGSLELQSSGSSIKICLVAEGKADIYPRLGITCEWDVAAAHAILKFAGGNLFIYNQELPISCYFNSSEFPQNIKYNKEFIQNPYFIVSGLHEYNM